MVNRVDVVTPINSTVSFRYMTHYIQACTFLDLRSVHKKPLSLLHLQSVPLEQDDSRGTGTPTKDIHDFVCLFRHFFSP